MMDCKKALVESNGILDDAIDHLRKTGITKAEKKVRVKPKKVSSIHIYMLDLD